MGNKIDYKFISDLEGGSKIKGYVPASAVSKSGVTIATGFDLGQRNISDLTSLGLAETLKKKFKPYLGKTKEDAKAELKKTPLTITAIEASSIDKAVKKKHVSSLILKYNSSSENTDKKKFSELPKEAQTVIASVSFQYGVNLNARAPKFWKAVTKQNWTEAITILKKFGDNYPTRRGKEAKLLEKLNDDKK